MAGAARGKFGYSFAYNQPESAILARALPRSLALAGTALVLSFVAGIAMALIQVARHGTATDRAIGVASLAVYSLPEFWLGQVALLTFAYVLPIFPAGGMVDPVMHPYMGRLAAFWDRIDHLILPAMTLAILSAAGIARFQRAALLDVA